MRHVIGIDEVGRAASKRRASPALIVGIDEVGRGPLAGPVTVCALALPKNFPRRAKGLGKLRNSKELSPRARERWFAALRSYPGVGYALARISPQVIDRINIARAANRAARRAFTRLLEGGGRGTRRAKVYLDGGLYLHDRRWAAENGVRAKTVIRGDEKFAAIAAASIIAKVTRDRHMGRLAREFPGYGFEIHKGYGTAAHRKALRKLGPSPHHRLTFLGRYGNISKKRTP